MRNLSFTQAAREFLDRLGDRSRQSAPQTFAVRCDCGHVVRGERKDGYQAIDCPECGQKVFALARNPRPMPKLRRGRPEKEPARNADQKPLAGLPDEESPPESATSTPPDQPTEATVVQEQAPPAVRRRAISIPRLATVGVCLLILLTGYGTWRQRQVRIYSAQLESATDEGLKLLKVADFVHAVERLGIADWAACGLGGDSPQERLAIQLHREAQLWLHLSREPLEAFIAQMDAADAGGDEASWNEQFINNFGRRTLIFDAWVSPPTQAEVEAAGEKERPPHHAEWMMVGERLRIELSLKGLRLIDELELDAPRRLIFGATVSGLRRSVSEPDSWFVELAPESGALITVAEPLEYFGWPQDESLMGVLESQQRLLGIK
jgi:DNA-directed RNA polymerase subunit RPC12/RpoP